MIDSGVVALLAGIISVVFWFLRVNNKVSYSNTSCSKQEKTMSAQDDSKNQPHLAKGALDSANADTNADTKAISVGSPVVLLPPTGTSQSWKCQRKHGMVSLINEGDGAGPSYDVIFDDDDIEEEEVSRDRIVLKPRMPECGESVSDRVRMATCEKLEGNTSFKQKNFIQAEILYARALWVLEHGLEAYAPATNEEARIVRADWDRLVLQCDCRNNLARACLRLEDPLGAVRVATHTIGVVAKVYPAATRNQTVTAYTIRAEANLAAHEFRAAHVDINTAIKLLAREGTKREAKRSEGRLTAEEEEKARAQTKKDAALLKRLEALKQRVRIIAKKCYKKDKAFYRHVLQYLDESGAQGALEGLEFKDA